MKTVCVLGLGYIGLPTASMLAAHGFQVLGVDVSERVVETVNRGEIHIEEPGLHTLVQAAIQSGNLRAATAPSVADVYIIAVPTPLTPDKRADLTHVEHAARAILPHLRPGALVILESTSPPGTCRDLLRPILESGGLAIGRDLFLAHCPERVLPGKILTELIANDRVIGGYDRASAEQAKKLYGHFVEGEIFLTDATSAEMVKLLENTYRDVNIALANETARLCEGLGIDFWEVARFANRHPRVNVHAAGPGVGGHCISVDPWFLVEKAPETARLIHLARTTNDGVPAFVAETALALLKNVDRPRIAVFGLAYKANVDDVRESPALSIVALLRERGAEVAVCDPHVDDHPCGLADMEACLAGADCLLLLTDHDEFKDIDPATVREMVRTPLLYDTRNCLDHDAWRSVGFTVHCIGNGRRAES